MNPLNLGDVLFSETSILKLFELKKSELARLRRKRGLPYVKLSSKCRVYLFSDLLTWATENRVVYIPRPKKSKGEPGLN